MSFKDPNAQNSPETFTQVCKWEGIYTMLSKPGTNKKQFILEAVNHLLPLKLAMKN